MLIKIRFSIHITLLVLLFGVAITSKSENNTDNEKQRNKVSDEAIIRRVADYVIDNTSYHLLDLRTGKSYKNSETLQPSDSIIVESHFNGWYYQNMMVLNGMNRIGKVLDNKKYSNYTDKNLDFILHHQDFFDRQKAMGKMPKPKGESEFSRISYYYNLSLPWMTGLANFWIERGRLTDDGRNDAFTKRFENFADSFNQAFNPKDCELVFISENKTITINIYEDVRRWWKGKTTEVEKYIVLDERFTPAAYNIQIRISDAYPSIKNDPRYCIRLANTGMWNPNTGNNDLGIVLTVN